MLISVVLGSALFFGFTNLDPTLLVGNNENEWNQIVGVALFFNAVSLFVSLPQKILLALSDTNKSNVVNLSSVIASSLGALVGSFFEKPILMILIIGMSLQFLLGIVVYINLHLTLKEKKLIVTFPELLTLKSTLFLGKSYFILQGLVIICSQLPTILIFHVLNPVEVSLYFTCYKMLSLPIGFTLVLFQPLWPSIAGKIALGDYEDARTLHNSKMKIATIIAGASLIWNIMLGGKLISFWTSGKIEPNFAFLAVLGLNVSVLILLQPILFTLNGLNKVKILIIWTSASMIFSTCSIVFLSNLLGVVGTVISMLVSNILIQLIPYYISVKKQLEKNPLEKNIRDHGVLDA